MSDSKQLQYDLTASEEDKGIAVLSHVLSIFTGIVGALIAYVVFKDRSSFLRWHTTTLLNFWITATLAGVIACVLTLIIIGYVLIPLIVCVSIIFPIVAAMQANDGGLYVYPVALKIIKQ